MLFDLSPKPLKGCRALKSGRESSLKLHGLKHGAGLLPAPQPLRQVGFAVELLETRHVHNALKIMPVKTDRALKLDLTRIGLEAGPL
jgi:hypothetical protein